MEKEKIMSKLCEVVEHNQHAMDKADGDQSSAIGLITGESKDGVDIFNPLFDDSNRFEVDPIDYYGLEFVLQLISDYEKVQLEK